MKKSRLLIYLLALLLMVCALTGCQQQETTLESLLPRANVIKVSASYLNAGLGDNIPQLSYEAVSSECTQLCDILYAAAPVVVDIPVGSSYSPELNASHEIYLTTSAGTMTLYYDDYQNLISVPINRKVNEQSVRVYLNFQAQGLNELLTAWQESLPAAAPEVPVPEAPAAVFPPDDSELRAAVDPALFEQASTEIAFEPTTYLRESEGAVYYAYGYHEKSELPQNKVLIAAVPEITETRQATITSIVRNDYYILVNVSFAAPAEGQALVDTAVMCERADIDTDQLIVFLDENRNILYVQQPDIPGEVPVSAVIPEATDQPTEPSTAAGGEEGDGEPLEP